MFMPPDSLLQFTIYCRPKDAPGVAFVARAWIIAPGAPEPLQGPAWAAESLEAARSVVPWGLVRTPRATDDDSCIVESWI